MQKAIYRYVLFAFSLIFMSFAGDLSSKKDIFQLITSLVFLALYAGITIKDKNRNWKQLFLLIIYTGFYLFFLLSKYIELLNQYLGIGIISLIVFSILSFGIWLRSGDNKDMLMKTLKLKAE